MSADRSELRARILDILENNSSRCCDDENDRNALTDALFGLADACAIVVTKTTKRGKK